MKSTLSWKYTPLKVIITYIIITLSATFWGPIKYYNYDYLPVIVFMLFVIVAVIFGYFSFNIGINNSLDETRCIKTEAITKTNINKRLVLTCIKICIIIALILEALLFFDNIMTLKVSSLSDILNRIINIGDTYKEALQIRRETTETSTLRQFITLFGITKQVAVIGAYYYRKELKLYRKVMYTFLIILIINTLAFNGQQKLFADLFIYIVSIVCIKQVYGMKKVKNKRKIIVLGAIVTVIFGFMQLSRADTYGYSYTTFSNVFFGYDNEHFFYKLFGDKIGGIFASLTYYFSGGYYGLSKSLNIPFEWTYGVGNSLALSSYATQYLGITYIGNLTYVARVEGFTGYPALQYWSTIFPWLASDFTFAGTVILMFFISRLYVKTWIESIKKDNILSVLLFSRLNILWAFVPANNQLMQTRESTIATIILFVLWFLFHKKTNYTIEKDESHCMEEI